MLTHVSCPACGAVRDDADGSCPARGSIHPAPPPAEDLIASWVATPAPPESSPIARDTVCLACGYEGPMDCSPDGHRRPCPACGEPWPDLGGILERFECLDCGEVIPLTDEHRGTTIICPRCHAFLGCLIDRRKDVRAWHSRLLGRRPRRP